MLNFKIKAVIFDMDGLLVDTESLWTEADIKIFNKLGVPLTPKMATETMGLREDEVIEYWFARYPWKEVPKQKVRTDILEEVMNLIKNRVKLMEGVNEVIELFTAQNIPMAVASSSEDIIIDAALSKVSIKGKMKVICSAEHEPYGKPHPGVYITTAEKLGVSPNECLVFEDSINGVLAAKAAKMKCVAVPDVHFKNNKGFSIADLTIDSLKDFTLEHLIRLEQ